MFAAKTHGAAERVLSRPSNSVTSRANQLVIRRWKPHWKLKAESWKLKAESWI